MNNMKALDSEIIMMSEETASVICFVDFSNPCQVI
jgi:hypothetical protein